MDGWMDVSGGHCRLSKIVTCQCWESKVGGPTAVLQLSSSFPSRLDRHLTSYNMEVDIAPETREALEANRTVRCLYRAKFRLESRHSRPVIAWAETLVRTLCGSMLEKMGQQAATADIQLNVVELLRGQSYAFLCFDVFLEDCDGRVRREIDQSLEQPIHDISRRGNVHYVRRHKGLDAIVAREYRRKRSLDKGPRPYFADFQNPPLYDGGVRVERPENGELEEDNWSDEDESDGDGPDGDGPEEDSTDADGRTRATT